MKPVEIRHAHFFCGLGGGAKGFNRAPRPCWFETKRKHRAAARNHI